VAKYLAKRTLSGLLALILFTVGMFVLIEVLTPGDFFTPTRMFLSADEVDALRAQYGLDKPLLVRYVYWLRTFLTHGIGQTTTGFNRSGSVTAGLPATLIVFIVGLALAYVFGAWLGRIAGWKRGPRGRSLTFLAVTSYTLFPPFVGFILAYFISHRAVELRNKLIGNSIDWVGVDRSAMMAHMSFTIIAVAILVFALGAGLARMFGKRRILSPLGKIVAITIICNVFWWYEGVFVYTVDIWFSAVVPITAFAILSYGDFLLVMRTSITGVMKEDYVTTGMAKGLPDRVVRDRHAGRNAIYPVLGRLVVSLPYLLSGLIIIEQSVGWPGLGSVLFAGVISQDLPVVLDGLLLIGVITLVVRLVFEVSQALLDPRVWRPV